MKKKLLLFLYSLSFLFIWAFGLLNTEADVITAIMGLSYTFLSAYFVQKQYNFELGLIEKLIILSGPVFYAFMFILIQGKLSAIFFISPILVAFIVLLLSIFYLKDLSKLNNLFTFTFITVFYAYIFFPMWKDSTRLTKISSFDSEVAFEKETMLNDSLSLFDFYFVNRNMDTVRLKNDEKYILIETWNESCPPCIKAFEDMPSFYKTIENTVNVYYLYEHHKAEVRNKFDKIFNYKHIEKRSNILIDLDQNLYRNMAMEGYPYFLLFDVNGKLVFSQKGYNNDIKKQLEQGILKIIGS